MSKLNMKEWINEIIQKKEVVAMPIMYGAQNEAYMSRSAEKWVRGLCFNELGVSG